MDRARRDSMRPLAIHGPLTPPSAKPLPAGRRHGEYVARLGITCHPRSRTAKGEDHAPACRWEKGSAARGGRLERARRGHTLGHTRPLDQEILLGNSLRKLVDRGRIELPTPGFSGPMIPPARRPRSVKNRDDAKRDFVGRAGATSVRVGPGRSWGDGGRHTFGHTRGGVPSV